MSKSKQKQQSKNQNTNNQNAKDQLGDENIVVSGNNQNSKMKA